MKNIIRILKYVLPYKRLAFLSLSFTLLSILFGVVSFTMVIPFLGLLFGETEMVSSPPELSWSINSILGQLNYFLSGLIANNGKEAALLFICVLVVVSVALKNLFRYLNLFFMVPLRNNVVADMRQKFYQKILNLNIGFFNEERKGDILTRMSADMQEIEESVMSSLETIFREPVTIIIYLICLINISPSLTLFVFLLLPVTGLVIGKLGKQLRSHASKAKGRLGQMLSHVEETLSGIRVIQAFNAEAYFSKRFDAENKALSTENIRVMHRKDGASPLSETLGVLVFSLVLWFGGRMVLGGSSDLTADIFIGFITLFSQLITPAKAFSEAFNRIQKGAASADRVEHFLQQKEKVQSKAGAPPAGHLEQELVFSNVSFNHGNIRVLDGINFNLKKGQTVALVGPSGAGKSTIADLVPRFHDTTEGSVLLDGKDIRELELKSLRNLLGVVNQEAILFNDTVYNNISFGMEVSREQVEAAAKVANAHEFITQLENGYETVIGERGGKLSGGQKQRLSIARAVLRNPEILILDEATSALDTTSERLVQEALSKLMENRTSLVIAHRLSTILHADLILVLEKGKIVERGTHAELMVQQGLYAKLIQMQQLV